jgi:CheY-like chemotaxis protein
MRSSPKKILIVDDDAALRLLLWRLLDEEYHLAEAATGAEALAMLPDFTPDLVMTTW